MLMLRARRLLWLVPCIAALGPEVRAQAVMDRTPNLPGAWVGEPGVLHFNFLHRFSVGPEPERKVTSTPTFLLAAGLPARSLLGVHYATNSELSPRYPNEWEVFGRVALLAQTLGAPLDLSAQAGYNFAAEGADGEFVAARRQGALRVLASLRALAAPGAETGAEVAIGSGLAVRLTSFLGVSADVVTLTDRDPGERVAWGAGLNLAIPHTPHTLSLHATNANNGTLQASTRGTRETRYGFEFTIPLTLSRYLGGGNPARGPAERTTSARIADFAFRPARLEVTAGSTVVWVNAGQVVHTITAADGSFDSGPIAPGERRELAFPESGSFAFHCAPHPFMRGVIVVR